MERTRRLPLVGYSILKSDRPYLLESARRHRHAVEEGRYPKLSIDEVDDLSGERFVDTLGLYIGYKLGEYQQAGESHEEYV